MGSPGFARAGTKPPASNIAETSGSVLANFNACTRTTRRVPFDVSGFEDLPGNLNRTRFPAKAGNDEGTVSTHTKVMRVLCFSTPV